MAAPADCVTTSTGAIRDALPRVGGPLPVVVGIVTAMVAAALAVKWLVGFLGKNSMALFGWWRIALAVLVWAALILAHPLLFGVSPLA